MYEVSEVSQLTGLAENTVRQYCSRATTLVRGRDYTVIRRSRFGRVDQRTLITKLGLLRLSTRDLKALDRASRRCQPEDVRIIERWAQECAAVNVGSPKSKEGKLRRRQLWTARLAMALVSTPCPHVGCLCKCHQLANGCYQVQPSGLSAPSTFAF